MTGDDEPRYVRLFVEIDDAFGVEARQTLRMIAELHKPVVYWRPWADEPPSCDCERGPWPCETIRTMATALGVALDAPVIDVVVSDASHTDTSTTRE